METLTPKENNTMAEKKPTNLIVPSQGGVMRDLVNRLKLIFRLIGDKRVNFFVKLIPLGTLIYMVSPIDAISIPVVGVLDDAAVIWLTSYLFVELCPPEVVQEIQKKLTSNMDILEGNDEVVEGESTDVTDKQ
ncbi:MAG: DUF1232 domain-containing protein [Chloroflexi bacterium]|nr:DUF1232 domain-containing protein [Chloroflexota bacterium]